MSEKNEESKKVRTSELIPQIKEIEEITISLKKIVDALPEGTVKTAYDYSVKNLEAKNEKFLNAGVKAEITPEQKEINQLIKKGKFAEAQEKLSALLSSSKNSDATSTGSNDEKQASPKGGKKKHN